MIARTVCFGEVGLEEGDSVVVIAHLVHGLKLQLSNAGSKVCCLAAIVYFHVLLSMSFVP